MDFSYRETALYKKLMKQPATLQEDIEMGFKGMKHVSNALHDIPAVRREYLYEIRNRIYLLFYVDGKTYLPLNEFSQILRRYCQLTDEEYNLLCEEYEATYKPPISDENVRKLLREARRGIHQQYQCDDSTIMIRIPLTPELRDLVLRNSQFN